MKFSEIYNFVLFHWGDEIDISDYIIRQELYSLPNGEKYDGYSKSSVNLSRKWNEVEAIIGTTNPYSELMVWTMFQVFHNTSESLFLKNIFILLPNEVDKSRIESQYYNNLKEQSWEKELAGYVNDLL